MRAGSENRDPPQIIIKEVSHGNTASQRTFKQCTGQFRFSSNPDKDENRNCLAESETFHVFFGRFRILHGMSFSVHNILGPGLLESAYEGAFCVELARAGIRFERQRIYPLHYKGELIGGYIADIVVADTIILELKSVSALNKVMEAQLVNYLKLSKLPIGYLMNFDGLKVEWKRFVNQRES
jgi:GxxExxY protein